MVFKSVRGIFIGSVIEVAERKSFDGFRFADRTFLKCVFIEIFRFVHVLHNNFHCILTNLDAAHLNIFPADFLLDFGGGLRGVVALEKINVGRRYKFAARQNDKKINGSKAGSKDFNDLTDK